MVFVGRATENDRAQGVAPDARGFLCVGAGDRGADLRISLSLPPFLYSSLSALVQGTALMKQELLLVIS